MSGEITATVAATLLCFTGVADGLPFEPFQFRETARAQRSGFNSASWAMDGGPFTQP